MNRLVTAILVVIVLAAATTWYFLREQTWTFSFAQAELEEQLAERFPLQKTYFGLITVHYDNPRVALREGSNRITIGLDARVNAKVNDIDVGGGADVVTRIAYDSETGSFLLHQPRLLNLDVPGVKPFLLDRARDAANELVAERIEGIPVYKLRPKDVKTSLARLILKEVEVRDGKLYLVLGL